MNTLDLRVNTPGARSLDCRARPGAHAITPALPRLGGSNPKGDTIAFTNAFMTFNGRPWLAVAGELHYSRCSRRVWREELLRMKALGVDIVSTYVFWIHHEEEEGAFVWTGDLDLRHFVETCGEAGMFAIIRVGPFCHGEVRNGGMPDWLYGRPFPLRSSDERYFGFVRGLYAQIGLQLEGLYFKNGGPVIGIQLENEFMHAGAPWETVPRNCQEWVPAGTGGIAHLLALKALAREAGMDAPLYTSTAWGGAPVAPEEMLPLYGGYAFCPWNVTESTPVHAPTREYIFHDFHGTGRRSEIFDPPYDAAAYPFACCEMGGGMQAWYRYRFTVEPRGVEAMALMKLAGGCSMLGYYMFHGGTNPVGRHGFLNEHVVPRLSYDFQAPLGEFGRERESARRLRRLHLFCRHFGGQLSPMATALPPGAEEITPTDADTLRYAARVSGDSGFLFLNNYQDHAAARDHDGVAVELLLPDRRLRVPHAGGFTLKAGSCAIMPFSMDVNGARLVYSTAQPMARLEAGGAVHFFFFAHDGIPAQYCFTADGITALDAAGATTRWEDGCRIVEPGAGVGKGARQSTEANTARPMGAIRITTSLGASIVIHTLTEEESLRFSILGLWGRMRAVICDADVYADNGSLKMRHTSRSQEPLTLLVLPAPEEPLSAAGGSGLTAAAGAALQGTAEGDFTRYSIPRARSLDLRALPGAPAAGRSVDVSVRADGHGNAEVTVPPGAFDGAREVILSIEYQGDVGSAFIDGRLVSDNFANGEPWEIGLAGLRPRILDAGMYIHVTPRREGTIVIRESAMARQEELRGREVAEIRSFTAYAVYEVSVTARSTNPPSRGPGGPR